MEKRKNQTFVLTMFDEYTPTVATSTVPITGEDWEATTSRFITVVMKKAPDPSPEGKDPEVHEFDDLRSELYLCRLTMAFSVGIISHDIGFRDEVKKQFSGRDLEIWRPLLTIAAIGSFNAYENVLSFAKQTIAERKTEEFPREKNLVRIVLAMFRRKYSNLQPENIICFTPKEVTDNLWSKLRGDFGFEEANPETHAVSRRNFSRIYSPWRIGHLLKKLGFKRNDHTKKGSKYEITAKEILEIASRIGLSAEDI